MLFDRESDTGTWVHIKRSYSQHQNWLLPNLSQEFDRTYRAGHNQFVFIEDNSTKVDYVEVFFDLPDLREIAAEIINLLR